MPTNRGKATPHSSRGAQNATEGTDVRWGHLRYTLCLVQGAWRDHGPILDSLYLAATDRDDGLVSAFGPLGPLHKEIYLDGDLLRTPIALADLVPFRVPPRAERGWLTLERLIHPSLRWTALAAYHHLIDACALHLADDPPAGGPPTHVASQPTHARIQHILDHAI
ncbi:MAG TPA: hypothetical protein VNL71_13355 [Chloroflexota bacterium]|nr:hypothetical protein [Chloroflexota bacterium]